MSVDISIWRVVYFGSCHTSITAQKKKFFIKDFFSNCVNLMEKSLIENISFFCSVKWNLFEKKDNG